MVATDGKEPAGRRGSETVRFRDAVTARLTKSVTMQGRATRSEFWLWYLFAFVTPSVVMDMVDFTFGRWPGLIVGPLLGLAVFPPIVAVTVRRLHDTNRSGWWGLVIFYPFVGLFYFLYLIFKRGTPGANRFGAQ